MLRPGSQNNSAEIATPRLKNRSSPCWILVMTCVKCIAWNFFAIWFILTFFSTEDEDNEQIETVRESKVLPRKCSPPRGELNFLSFWRPMEFQQRIIQGLAVPGPIIEISSTSLGIVVVTCLVIVAISFRQKKNSNGAVSLPEDLSPCSPQASTVISSQGLSLSDQLSEECEAQPKQQDSTENKEEVPVASADYPTVTEVPLVAHSTTPQTGTDLIPQGSVANPTAFLALMDPAVLKVSSPRNISMDDRPLYSPFAVDATDATKGHTPPEESFLANQDAQPEVSKPGSFASHPGKDDLPMFDWAAFRRAVGAGPVPCSHRCNPNPYPVVGGAVGVGSVGVPRSNEFCKRSNQHRPAADSGLLWQRHLIGTTQATVRGPDLLSRQFPDKPEIIVHSEKLCLDQPTTSLSTLKSPPTAALPCPEVVAPPFHVSPHDGEPLGLEDDVNSLDWYYGLPPGPPLHGTVDEELLRSNQGEQSQPSGEEDGKAASFPEPDKAASLPDTSSFFDLSKDNYGGFGGFVDLTVLSDDENEGQNAHFEPGHPFHDRKRTHDALFDSNRAGLCRSLFAKILVKEEGHNERKRQKQGHDADEPPVNKIAVDPPCDNSMEISGEVDVNVGNENQGVLEECDSIVMSDGKPVAVLKMIRPLEASNEAEEETTRQSQKSNKEAFDCFLETLKGIKRNIRARQRCVRRQRWGRNVLNADQKQKSRSSP